MSVVNGRKKRQNLLNPVVPIIIVLLLSISFIGESTGFNLLDSSSGSNSTCIDDGKVDSTFSESSIDSSEKEQIISTDDLSSDTSDTTKIDTITSNDDNTVDISTTNTTKDNTCLIYPDDDTLINTTSNITNTFNNSGFLLNNFAEQINIDNNTLEYFLNKFNQTEVDEELKERFLELAKNTNIIEELKSKISTLIYDFTLDEEELKLKLLNYIRIVTFNEREVLDEEIASKVESVYGNIESGEKAQVLIGEINKESRIENVKFIAKRNLSDVRISIIKLKQKPEDIPYRLSTNKTVYQYLDIKLTSEEEYISDDDIETLTFTFVVDLTWIKEKNIDKKTIMLTRYHYGEWQNLSTNLLSQNETCIVFEAETPGCSTFAVVGSTLVEIPEPYVTETPEIPWMVIIGVIASTTIILVTVLFKARYIYFEEGSHKSVYFEGDPHKLKIKNNKKENKKFK